MYAKLSLADETLEQKKINSLIFTFSKILQHILPPIFEEK